MFRSKLRSTKNQIDVKNQKRHRYQKHLLVAITANVGGSRALYRKSLPQACTESLKQLKVKATTHWQPLMRFKTLASSIIWTEARTPAVNCSFSYCQEKPPPFFFNVDVCQTHICYVWFLEALFLSTLPSIQSALGAAVGPSRIFKQPQHRP